MKYYLNTRNMDIIETNEVLSSIADIFHTDYDFEYFDILADVYENKVILSLDYTDAMITLDDGYDMSIDELLSYNSEDFTKYFPSFPEDKFRIAREMILDEKIRAEKALKVVATSFGFKPLKEKK